MLDQGWESRWQASGLFAVFAILAIPFSMANDRGQSSSNLFDLSRECRQWGVDEGMPLGRIECVAQTPDGSIWMGGPRLLCSFNGDDFERYDPSGLFVPGHSTIDYLEVAKDGDLWAATRAGTLSFFDSGQFQAGNWDLPVGELSAISSHPDGGLVSVIKADSGDHYLHRINRDRATLLYHLDGGADLDIASVCVTADGRCWMTGHQGMLWEVTKAGCRRASLDDGGFGRFFETEMGKIELIGFNGIHAYREGGWKTHHRFEFPMPDSVLVQEACRDSDGHYWFVARGGSLWVIPPGERARRLEPRRGEVPEPVTDLFSQSDGSVWCSSFVGLSQIRYSPFVSATVPVELPVAGAMALGEDRQGRVLVTCHGAICVLDDGFTTLRLVERTHPHALVRPMGAGNGGIWMLGSSGEMKLRENGSSRIITGLPGAVCTGVIIDPSNTVWVSTARGLYRFHPKEGEQFVQVLVDGLGPGNQSFQHLVIDEKGRIYVASKGNGVFLRDPESGKWSQVGSADHPALRNLSGLSIDPTGGLWSVGNHGAGLGYHDGGETLYVEHERLGLEYRQLIGVAFDNDDGVWFASQSKGVGFVSGESLREAMKDPARELRITWFDRRHGLASMNGPFWPEGIRRLSDGRICIATAAGISLINPAQWRRYWARSTAPQLQIENCAADGESIAIASSNGGRIVLPVGTDWLKIGFRTREVAKPGEVRYRYRLHGLSDEWIDAGTEPRVQLNQLPVGEYRFEVVAGNRYGQWSSDPAALLLVIPPRWYQTTAFRGMLMLVGIASVASVYFLRVGQLKRSQRLQEEDARKLIQAQEVERARVAGELHDGLGQNLMVMKDWISAANHEGKSGPDGGGGAFIEDLMSDTIEEVRRMSHTLRPFVLDRLGLAAAIRDLISKTAEGSGLEIECDCDEVDGVLSRENEINLYRVLQESLSNILKHSDASRVQVALKRKESNLSLTVADDGRGFNPSDQLLNSTGMGLSGIRERVRIMGGSVRWTSAPRQGATLQLEVPA